MLSNTSLLFGLSAAQRTANRSLSSKSSTPINSTLFNIVVATKNFGILQDYNERRNKKLTNGFLLNDRPMYWVTSSRPSNFGDPLDAKTKADNWFDENRYVIPKRLIESNDIILTVIEFGMRRIVTMKSNAHNFTWSRVSFSATTSSVSRPLSPCFTTR